MAASMDFDGTDGYFDCGDISLVEGIDKISISMMVNFDIIDPSGSDVIIMKGAGNDTSIRIMNWDSGAGRILFDTADGTVGGGKSFDASGLSTGVWYHLCCTKDMTTNPDTTLMYLDGVSQTTTDFSNQDTTVTGSDTNVFMIGRTSNDASRFFDGKLAYLSIYNTALSQSEVDELRFKPESIVNGRVCYWPLFTTSCKDLSGNGNDGTLNGGVTASDLGPPVYFPEE